jgi:hypothetical protein
MNSVITNGPMYDRKINVCKVFITGLKLAKIDQRLKQILFPGISAPSHYLLKEAQQPRFCRKIKGFIVGSGSGALFLTTFAP